MHETSDTSSAGAVSSPRDGEFAAGKVPSWSVFGVGEKVKVVAGVVWREAGNGRVGSVLGSVLFEMVVFDSVCELAFHC